MKHINDPSKTCRLCGVEVAASVAKQHTNTVPCEVRRLIKTAHENGLVRCEDAIFSQLTSAELTGANVRAGKLKTGITTHPGKADMYSAIEESWADSVAVALMRRAEWSMEMRLDAVRRYAEWRKDNPLETVHAIAEETTRVDGWKNCREIGVSFSRRGTMVRYDGGGAR